MSNSCTADPDTPYWIALDHVRGIGPVRTMRLVDAFGCAERAWHGSPARLRRLVGAHAAAAIVAGRRRVQPVRLAEEVRSKGIQTITARSPGYPELLRQIRAFPALLYLRGDAQLLATRCVSVVGTRRATGYGMLAARRIARGLARQGITIVSGMAAGIDGAAHNGALECGGGTIAVLGCGVDVVYPSIHARLKQRIEAGGAVISEFPPGTPPEPGHFPRRNRIVAGLSQAIVVTEAGPRSGALITAKLALDEGRDVLAVPGPIYAEGATGTNGLIGVGAGVAVSANDVLAALAIEPVAAPPVEPAEVPDDPTQVALLARLRHAPTHIDDLCLHTGFDSAEVARALSVLELKGMIVHMGNMKWTVDR